MEASAAGEDGEVLLESFKGIECHLDDRALGLGDLTLTNRKIVWASSAGVRESWSWREVVMHAEATDAAVHVRPCLYAHLQGADEETLNELRLVPQDAQGVHALFQAFNRGAELNPDPPGEHDEDEGDWIFNAQEVYGADYQGEGEGEDDGEGEGAYDDDEAMEDADE